MTYFRVNDRCNGCLACVENCPADALRAMDKKNKRSLQHNMARCARCGNCWRVCPQDAVEFQHLLFGDWDTAATLELSRCRVCGEILYTAPFGEHVSGKIRRPIEPLCPRHRDFADAFARAVYIPDGKKTKEVAS